MRGVDDPFENAASFLTKGYVEDNFLSLDGGTLTGDLTVQDSGTVRIEAVSTDTDAITMAMEGRTDRGRLVASNGSYIDFYDGFINTNVSVRGGEPVHDSGYTTRGYVNDNFLSLDGGTLDGNIEFAPSSGNAIQILNAVGDGLSGFRFESDGDSYAFMYLKPENDELRIEKRTANAGFSSNELVLFDTYSAFSKEVRGPDPTNNAGFTPKKYVEDNFLSLDGGIITGDNVAFPRIEFDVDPGKSGGLTFKVDSTLVGTISGSSDFLYLLGPNGSYFSIQPTFTFTNVELRGPNPTNNAGYTPKKYVEDNFLSLNGGTIDGPIKVAATSNQHLTLDTVSSGNATLELQRGAVTESRIRSNSNHLLLDYVEGSGGSTNLALYFNEIIANKPISGQTATEDDHLVRKDYVDDNFLSLDGGTSSGNIRIENNDFPTFIANTTHANKQASYEMQIQGVRKGLIYVQSDSLRLRQSDNAFTTNNEVVIGENQTSFSTDVNLIGGELNIDNAGSFSNRITVNATNTGLAQYRMNQDDKIIGLLYSQNSTVFLRQYNDPDNFGVGSQLQFTDGSVTATHGDLRSNNMGSATTSVTTKRYVEDNFLSLNGGTIQSDSGGTSLTIHGNTANANLFFQDNDAVDGVIFNGSGNINILKYHSNSGTDTGLTLANDFVSVNKEVRVTGGDITLTNTGVAY